jgi:hypothetical protein
MIGLGGWTRRVHVGKVVWDCGVCQDRTGPWSKVRNQSDRARLTIPFPERSGAGSMHGCVSSIGLRASLVRDVWKVPPGVARVADKRKTGNGQDVLLVGRSRLQARQERG